MELHPELTEYGYEIIQVLGHNYGSARSTYLAKKIANQQLVVVKLFRFPKSANQFSTYEKAIAREAQILSQLQHPMIPCYLNRFDIPDGYCIVQEYIEAQSLANQHSFNLQQIQHIAIAALEVLVYLQSQTPPIIHRDLKPENLLVSDDLKLYLVDFGFARIGMTDVAMSSVAAGTFGFMAPEQLRNSNLSKATDLYGLGMTLVCLLTGIRSIQIDHLIDETNQIEFQHLLTNVNPRFVQWLKKMTAPRLKDRYSEASIALANLHQVGNIGASAKAITSRWRRMPIYLLPVTAIASLFAIFPNPSSENLSSNSQITPSSSPASLPLPSLYPCNKYRHLKLTKTEAQDVSDSIVKLQIYRKCRGCNFRGARFISEDLIGVDLQNADLTGANLIQVNLSGSNLKGAKLEGTDFSQANLENVDFSETTSNCADFGQAELQKAKLVRANLRAANFSQANMASSDLSYANLTSADLTQTDLSKANLNYANLTNTNLLQTVLKNATMQEVIIKNTKIEQTDFPNGDN
ncbi:serine/threonine-protein kinase [Pseudanabaena sp. BC1403]|uniref:serine/threonine-protein kinase n=1 Tax=Pseudanabaena sp. BC1403 TaxID=2043171 RepID=UPI000CD983F7|nr:serine/threonine-protein kinase [Pseudanabaena sp. BC1403]